jgi:FRG domain
MECIKFKQWADFRSWIDKNRRAVPVYWRGQKDPSWPLASRFEREILNKYVAGMPETPKIYPYDGQYDRDGKRTWKDGFYEEQRDRYLEAFKVAAAGLRGPNPASLDDDQWWALGRHFDLITPLLDWTYSPYIASFFPQWEVFSEDLHPSGAVFLQGREIAVYRLIHNNNLTVMD